jgi:sugar-1,4-lactone oxidase-like protein
MPHRFRNWGRTAGSLAEALLQPTNEAEVAALIKRAAAGKQRVKVVGAGHSWSDIACTDGLLVNLDRLDRTLAVDADRLEITVEAGIRLKALNELLATHGLALPVLGSIAEQSVAGAISTGTHGSAPKLGSISSSVIGLRLVTASGEFRDLSAQDGDLFQAARVGLGALGIITRVTLRCVPAFRLEEESGPMPFADAVAAIPALVATEPFVKLWWLPHTGAVQVSRYRPTTKPSTFSPLVRWLEDRLVNRLVFAFVLLLGSVVPALIPTLNRLVKASYFKAVRKVARSDLALTIPMPPRHEETEYAIPLERAGEALRWLDAFITREQLHVNFIAEARFVAADEALLSPAFGRASCFIGAYMARTAGIDRYFEAFQQQMLALGGRPHWGKQFHATAEELRAVHPNYERFEAIRRELDPAGMFRNAFLDRVFPPEAKANALGAVSSG